MLAKKVSFLIEITVTPEFGIEIPSNVSYMDLRTRAEAACKTINELQNHGLDVKVTEEDRDVASALLTTYAGDPDTTSKAVTDRRIAKLTTGALLETHRILDEYGRVIVGHAAEIRNTVINKLVIESENTDPRVRLKALELLGKMSDVGLFTDRKEVTVTHKTTESLRDKLREKLEILKSEVEITDAEYEVVKEK